MNTLAITPITESVICGKASIPTNKSRLMAITNSGYDIPYNDASWAYKSLKAQLDKTITKVRNNVLQIEYNRVDKNDAKLSNLTRAKAVSCISLGDTSRSVRAGVWGDTCFDFDMCCAHQSEMVSALTEEQRILFPTLIQYVENKKQMRQEIADEMFDGNVDDAKQCMVALTFGSSLSSAFKDCKDKQKSYPVIAVKFQDEILKFANLVCDANPDWYKLQEKVVKKKNNKKIKSIMQKEKCTKEEATKKAVLTNAKMSMVSVWCQNKEAIIMECVIKYCIDNGIIQDRRFDNSKDGVMIPIDDVEAYLTREDLELDDIPMMFTDVVEEQTGFRIKFERKDMMDDHNAFWETISTFKQEVSTFDEEQVKRFDREFMQELDTYAQKKEYFELFFAYVHKTQCFVHISSVRDITDEGLAIIHKDFIYYSSSQKFSTSWGHLDSNEYDEMQRNIPFVNLWQKDSTRREYMAIGCQPYAGIYDPTKNKDDELNAFRGYPEHIWKEPVLNPDAQIYKKLGMFFKMQAHLVGEEGYDEKTGDFAPITCYEDLLKSKKLSTWLHIVGHRIARPDEPRKPYVPIVHGAQGTGKNMSTDNCFAHLVGENHYKCSADIEDFFGTHATGLCGKIIAVMNEASVKTSGKYKNKLKGMSTDKKATVNEKFVPQYEFVVRALIIILSNENCPVQLEMNTNRRYLVMMCNQWLASAMTEKTWAAVAKYYESTSFQRALRAFFERIDYDAFDYAEAKRDNARSKAYKKMMAHFVSPVLRFFKNYIEDEMYNRCKFNDDETEFYKNPKWNENVSINSSELQGGLKGFLTEEKNPLVDSYSSVQKFNNAIKDFGLPMVQTLKHKTTQWTFIPKEVYSALIDKMVVDVDLLSPEAVQAIAGCVSKVMNPDQESSFMDGFDDNEDF